MPRPAPGARLKDQARPEAVSGTNNRLLSLGISGLCFPDRCRIKPTHAELLPHRNIVKKETGADDRRFRLGRPRPSTSISVIGHIRLRLSPIHTDEFIAFESPWLDVYPQ
jgi:hypothetical protein